MKKPFILLLSLLLLAHAARADSPQIQYLTTPDGLTLTWYDGPSGAISTSETFLHGYYIDEDWEASYALNLLLAEAGDTNAMLRLGDHHLSGLGTAQNGEAALNWYQRALDEGEQTAHRSIALMYLNGWDVAPDAVLATEHMTQLAEQTGIGALELAQLYLLGHGSLASDMDKALYWFDLNVEDELYFSRTHHSADVYQARYDQKKEAFLATQTLPDTLTTRPSPVMWADDVPHASDAMDMGYFWRDGSGGVVDHSEAARWFEKAIELSGNSGVAAAWSHAALAEYYRDGTLGFYDIDKALEHAKGQQNYCSFAGDIYFYGITAEDGTVILEPDVDKAIEFYLQGADHDVGSIEFIADCYYTGEHLQKDYDKAIELYLDGMQLGSAHCAKLLEELYAEGKLYAPEMLRNLAWTAGNGSPSTEANGFLLTLARDLIYGKYGTDGTLLVEAKQYEHAFWVLRHLAGLRFAENTFVYEWMGWFYCGNRPEVQVADYYRAAIFYNQAANLGSGYATAQIGVLYRDGKGVEADADTARYYFDLALRMGYAQAQTYLDALPE